MVLDSYLPSKQQISLKSVTNLGNELCETQTHDFSITGSPHTFLAGLKQCSKWKTSHYETSFH